MIFVIGEIFFCMWISIFPAPFIQKTVPSLMCILNNLVENQLTVDSWIYFQFIVFYCSVWYSCTWIFVCFSKFGKFSIIINYYYYYWTQGLCLLNNHSTTWAISLALSSLLSSWVGFYFLPGASLIPQCPYQCLLHSWDCKYASPCLVWKTFFELQGFSKDSK